MVVDDSIEGVVLIHWLLCQQTSSSALRCLEKVNIFFQMVGFMVIYHGTQYNMTFKKSKNGGGNRTHLDSNLLTSYRGGFTLYNKKHACGWMFNGFVRKKMCLCL